MKQTNKQAMLSFHSHRLYNSCYKTYVEITLIYFKVITPDIIILLKRTFVKISNYFTDKISLQCSHDIFQFIHGLIQLSSKNSNSITLVFLFSKFI